MTDLFEAAADVVEESICNAVCMAGTIKGPQGRIVEAIDLDTLRSLWQNGGLLR